MSDEQARPSIGLPTLKEISARVLDGSLLPIAYYADLDCDAALDAREAVGEFDAGRSHLFDQIDSAWGRAAVAEATQEQIGAACREAYGVVDRATRHHEIAAYVADDLELIARGAVLGRDDHMLTWLWRAYDAGQFPLPWSPRTTILRQAEEK